MSDFNPEPFISVLDYPESNKEFWIMFWNEVKNQTSKIEMDEFGRGYKAMQLVLLRALKACFDLNKQIGSATNDD